MAFPRTIRNFNTFLDGVSYFGRATEGTLPNMRLKTGAHRGAGMDAEIAIDLGMEAMTATIKLAEWVPDALRLFGTTCRLVHRPVARGENGDVTGFVATCEGLISGNDPDTLKGGDQSLLTITQELRYYKLEVDGAVIHEIDIENGKRLIDGNDQLADIRAAMGL